MSASASVSADPSAGVSSFLSAWSALHHHPDVAVKAEANRWLMSFQASREAWQAADSILHTPQLGDDVYYNAANILRHKLLHNYADLPGKDTRSALHAHAHRSRQPTTRYVTLLTRPPHVRCAAATVCVCQTLLPDGHSVIPYSAT